MEGIADASFLFTEAPPGEQLVDETLAVCADIGLSAVGDSHVDSRDATIEFDDAGAARTRLYWREVKRPISLSLQFDPEPGPEPSLRIACNPDYITGADFDGTNYTGFTGVYVELVRDLSVALETMYACSRHADPHTKASPEEVWPTAPSFNLERVPWLSVFSASLIERLGWTDRIRETPAWRVKPLESGHILLLKTSEPWENEGPDHPVDRYLFDGDHTETDGGTDRSASLKDPFSHLAVGEHGADICVHRNDITTELPNEILEPVRVRIDENRDLRRVDSGRFLRNVVDPEPEAELSVTKRMLANVPDDATDDDLYVSALLRDVIPPSFVRLDDPDGENIVTKVTELDTDVSKIKLLVSLGRVAQQDDFTAEDLNSMEGALNTLKELDDEDNIDQYIRERLL